MNVSEDALAKMLHVAYRTGATNDRDRRHGTSRGRYEEVSAYFRGHSETCVRGVVVDYRAGLIDGFVVSSTPAPTTEAG